MEGSNIVSLVLYTHALEIVLSGPFTCEPNTIRFATKSCPYNIDYKSNSLCEFEFEFFLFFIKEMIIFVCEFVSFKINYVLT